MAPGVQTGLILLRAHVMLLKSGSLVQYIPQVSEQVLMLSPRQTGPAPLELLGPHPPHLPKYL